MPVLKPGAIVVLFDEDFQVSRVRFGDGRAMHLELVRVLPTECSSECDAGWCERCGICTCTRWPNGCPVNTNAACVLHGIDSTHAQIVSKRPDPA